MKYARLAQWIEHLATNQGFVGVQVPHRVPKRLFDFYKKICYNIYRKLIKKTLKIAGFNFPLDMEMSYKG